MIIENIKEYLLSKGIPISRAEKNLRVSNGALSKPIQNNRTIKTDMLEKFLFCFQDVNPEWLLTGKGSMLRDPNNYQQPVNDFSLATDRKEEYQSIPLYDLEATAGLVPLFKNGNKTPTDFIQIPHLPKCDGAVYVTGDSMYPLLKSGDIVLYKKINDIKNNIFWGEMYLVSVDMDGEEYIAVKYIQKSELKDHIKLVSYNQHHADKNIPLSKINALAFIKASIRINSMV